MASVNAKESFLYESMREILRLPKSPSYYTSPFSIEVTLHTPEKDLSRFEGVTFLGKLLYRDYVDNMADYIEIQLSVMLGTYFFDIKDHLENIELTIYKTRQERPDGEEIIVEERYKAVFLLERNRNIPNISTVSERDILNQQPPTVLTLQLVDRSSEAIRIKTIQGSFDKSINPKNSNMGIKPFLQSVLTTHLDAIRLEGKKVIDRLDIEEPDNSGELTAFTVPTGTRLVGLTELIQSGSNGIYNSGVGNYVQRYSKKLEEWEKCFFVYSLYDGNKYHEAEQKIIFYAPPTSMYSSTEKTYEYKDGVLKVITDTISTLNEVKESVLMNKGVGFRTGSSYTMMKKPTIITEDGPVFTKTGFNTEVIHKDRDDGINYSPYRGMSANNFKRATEVMAMVGTYVRLTANNLEHDYFYPGAPCKLVYMDKDDEVVEMLGVIHRIRGSYEQPGYNPLVAHKHAELRTTSQSEFDVYITDVVDTGDIHVS